MLVSLCIPTNGVVEWVLPVLDSMYKQKCSLDLYEVVISDNGVDSTLYSHIKEYIQKYPNIIYKRSKSKGFLNQIDAFNLASGKLIKFVNHRAVLLDSTIQYLCDFANKYYEKKPIVFFSNGNLRLETISEEYKTFSDFMEALKVYSSWSGGIAFWRDDYVSMIKNVDSNELFPTFSWLSYYTERSFYVIDNKKLVEEVAIVANQKGRYNLFRAFAVVYVELLQNLKIKKYIDDNSYEAIYSDVKCFIARNYCEFILNNKPCSYSLEDYRSFIDCYFDFQEIHDLARYYDSQQNIDTKIIEYFGRVWDIRHQRRGRPLYIYGAGVAGRMIANIFQCFDMPFDGFIDKNKDSGTEYCRHRIIKLDSFRDFDAQVVISLFSGDKSIAKLLTDMGMSNDDIYYFWEMPKSKVFNCFFSDGNCFEDKSYWWLQELKTLY